MIAVILLTVPLVIMMCVLAYRLATFALPFMLALEAARFAYATGAGWIGAGVVGFFAGVASFGILAFLFATLRAPILRLAVALAFAAPAAVAGYSLMHGVTREAVPSELWRQIFFASRARFSSAVRRLRGWPIHPPSTMIVDGHRLWIGPARHSSESGVRLGRLPSGRAFGCAEAPLGGSSPFGHQSLTQAMAETPISPGKAGAFTGIGR